MNNNGDIVNFNGDNATDSFKSKAKTTGQADDDGEIDNVEINGSIKVFKQVPLINCEVSFISTLIILTWSENCVIVSINVANQDATFTVIETKLYVPLVTLSIQNNVKLLPQLNLGF